MEFELCQVCHWVHCSIAMWDCELCVYPWCRQQLAGGEARHHRGQPDVLARGRRGGGGRRGRRGGAGRAGPGRPAHGLRSDHALFPQPQGINRHAPSHHASSVVLLCACIGTARHAARRGSIMYCRVSMFDVLSYEWYEPQFLCI